MKKQVINKFGKHYLLGEDHNGTKYYLEQASWDCGWYWGLGYIHTFTNNKNPKYSRDIQTHTHFDSMFLNKNRNGYDEFKDFFKETVLNEKETWQLIELMKSLYIAREYSDFLNRGGAHYTQNACGELIKNNDEYERINKTVIPGLLNKVYELLS